MVQDRPQAKSAKPIKKKKTKAKKKKNRLEALLT
jgi:hypothetical protein